MGKHVSEKNADHAAGFIKKATGSVEHEPKVSLIDGVSEKVEAKGKLSLGSGKTVGGSVGISLTPSSVEVSAKVKLQSKDYTVARSDHETKSKHSSESGTFTAKTESKSSAKVVSGKAGSLEFSDEGIKASAKASAMGKVSSKATCSGSVCGVEVSSAEVSASAAVGAQAKAKAKISSSGGELALGGFVGGKAEVGCKADFGGAVSVGAKGGVVAGIGAEANVGASVKNGTLSVSLGGTLSLGIGFTADLSFSVKLPKWLGGGD